MEPNNIYILISVLALVLIGLVLFIKQKSTKKKVRTPLTNLAYAFVLAGILFGEERFLGYSLLGIGVLLSVIDIIRNKRLENSSKK